MLQPPGAGPRPHSPVKGHGLQSYGHTSSFGVGGGLMVFWMVSHPDSVGPGRSGQGQLGRSVSVPHLPDWALLLDPVSFLFIQESDIFFLENGLGQFLEASLLPVFRCCYLCLYWGLRRDESGLLPSPTSHLCSSEVQRAEGWPAPGGPGDRRCWSRQGR